MELELLREIVDETIPSATLFYRCGNLRFGVYMDTFHFFYPPITRFWLIYGEPEKTYHGEEEFAVIDRRVAQESFICHPDEAMAKLKLIQADPQDWLTKLVL